MNVRTLLEKGDLPESTVQMWSRVNWPDIESTHKAKPDTFLMKVVYSKLVLATERQVNQLKIELNHKSSIKYFPFKTSTQHIHTFFKTELVKSRAASIARRFALSRLHHEQLANDYNSFRSNCNPNHTYKH